MLTLVLIKVTLSVHSMFVLGLISGVITLFSGMVFLTSALLIVGLPAPLSTLFVIVVIPTAIANALSGAILFKLFQTMVKPNLDPSTALI